MPVVEMLLFPSLSSSHTELLYAGTVKSMGTGTSRVAFSGVADTPTFPPATLYSIVASSLPACVSTNTALWKFLVLIIRSIPLLRPHTAYRRGNFPYLRDLSGLMVI